jgi:hypothetical protein
MPWVYRDLNGSIIRYSTFQNDPGQEFLAEDSSEWIAYLAAIDLKQQLKNLSDAHYAALDAIEYDFGDGRVIQTRPKDETNFRLAIADGLDRLWIMKDNKAYMTTVAELQTAADYGKAQATSLWDNFAAALNTLQGV